MKQSIVLLLVLITITSCYQQERNCTSFKVGTFEFETYLNGELTKTTFVRNDSIEIDYYIGKSDTASVRWINDCEYVVTKLHPKNMAEEKAIHMKILATHKDSYTFEYGLVGSAKGKQQGTAKKIK